MAYTIIKGTFHVAGYSPDGDSIRFEAANPANWDKFPFTGNAVRAKRKQLRLEGIDALETHYEESHQPRSIALAALELLLDMLGIGDLTYNLAVTSIVAAKDGTPGYLAVLGIDGFNRPISLAFPGDTPLKDGALVEFTKLPMEKCVNLRLLKQGLAYPTFYDSMPDALMDLFAAETRKARTKKTGIWALDRSRGFHFHNADTIVNDVVILPKLFRRLTTFLQNASDYGTLAAYLQKSGDHLLVRSTGKKTDLGALIAVDGRQISLTADPEDLVFSQKS